MRSAATRSRGGSCCDAICCPIARPKPWRPSSRKHVAGQAGDWPLGIVARYVPQRLAETVAAQAGLDPERRAAEVSRTERQRLVAWLKQFDIPVSGTLGFNKAEVTAGGVALDEVDSHTMESRLVPGLFFAGEILDIDGPIGGYNFQAAFSTGWLAGETCNIIGRYALHTGKWVFYSPRHQSFRAEGPTSG